MRVDVDGLKAINDSFGHAAGDQAIAETSSIVRCTFHESDVVARLDGDEFVAIALDADRAAAARVLARLDEALVEHRLRATTPYHLSFSAGASVLAPPARPTLNDLLDDAERALCANKRGVPGPAWLSARARAADVRPTVAA